MVSNFIFRKLMILFAGILCFVIIPAQDASGKEGFKNVNGIGLYYKIMGDGEPIIVLHGGPGLDHSYFLPHMGELASDYQLIFFDQRLSGRSSGEIDSSEITIDAFVEDIEGIRQALGLDKINLIGHSWGGFLGMKYGIKYPQNLKSLILVNTAPASSEYLNQYFKIISGRLTAADTLAQQKIRQSEAFKRGDKQAYEKLMRISYKYSLHDTAMVDHLNLDLPENFAENSAKLQRLGKEIMQFDFHKKLKNISCPTLIIHGESDAIPVEAIERIHHSISGSRFVLLESSGHFPFMETPEAFFETIRSFMGKPGNSK